MPIKIGVEPPKIARKSKYTKYYNAILENPDTWIEITPKEGEKASLIRTAMIQRCNHHDVKITTAVRGNVLYVRKK